ncbi:hypothetical protein EON82_14325 [bacterium]|nr:MAG: hypothetical protein EON82_14325 [bacterium]
METRNIRLVVATMGEDHSSETLEAPTLDSLTDALSDLYARLGCEASSREVKAEVVGSAIGIYSEDPEASPEAVAAELWDKLIRSTRPGA